MEGQTKKGLPFGSPFPVTKQIRLRGSLYSNASNGCRHKCGEEIRQRLPFTRFTFGFQVLLERL